MSRILSMLAAGAVTGLAAVLAQVAPAQANASYAVVARANDAKHAVGDTWQEVLPDGEKMTVVKISSFATRSTTPVRLSTSQCSGYPYLCAWQNSNATGAFWRYNMNNVYSNTANGVEHCWNMAADANNNQRRWINKSSRDAFLFNWVNCNDSGGFFVVGQAGTDDDVHCEDVNTPEGHNWCSVYLATSIKAFA